VARLSPDLFRSDHASFWNAEIPAIFIGDSAEFRNPNYHQPGDRIETLDLDFAAEVSSWVAEAIRALIEAKTLSDPPQPDRRRLRSGRSLPLAQSSSTTFSAPRSRNLGPGADRARGEGRSELGADARQAGGFFWLHAATEPLDAIEEAVRPGPRERRAGEAPRAGGLARPRLAALVPRGAGGPRREHRRARAARAVAVEPVLADRIVLARLAGPPPRVTEAALRREIAGQIALRGAATIDGAGLTLGWQGLTGAPLVASEPAGAEEGAEGAEGAGLPCRGHGLAGGVVEAAGEACRAVDAVGAGLALGRGQGA
jgi:hypothetical protein